jgi:hypothetical protein
VLLFSFTGQTGTDESWPIKQRTKRKVKFNMKEIIFKVLNIILIAGAIVLVYLSVQKALKNQAVDGCLRATSAKFKNDVKQDVTTPDGYWYSVCMKEKGLK